MNEIKKLKKAVETGKVTDAEITDLINWLQSQLDAKRPSTQSDPGDHPLPPPPHGK